MNDESIWDALLDYPDDEHDINTIDFLEACRLGRVEKIEQLAGLLVDVEATLHDDITGLQLAAANNHVRAVSRLLELGADPNHASAYGWMPLMHAAYHGHYDIVQILLDNSYADIDAQTLLGASALTMASRQGHITVAKLLIDFEAQVDVSSVLVAVQYGHEALVELLLEQYFDINAQLSYTGLSALMVAAVNGRMAIAELLEAKGARLTLKDVRKCNAMELAREAEEFETEAFLGSLEVRSKYVKASADKGSSFLLSGDNLIQALKTDKIDVVAQIVNSDNSFINWVHPDTGATPLLVACHRGAFPIVSMLIENGADVHYQDTIGGWTPFMSAAFAGHKEIVTKLLECGVDPAVKSFDGFTAFDLALLSDETDPDLLFTLAQATNKSIIDVRRYKTRGIRRVKHWFRGIKRKIMHGVNNGAGHPGSLKRSSSLRHKSSLPALYRSNCALATCDLTGTMRATRFKSCDNLLLESVAPTAGAGKFSSSIKCLNNINDSKFSNNNNALSLFNRAGGANNLNPTSLFQRNGTISRSARSYGDLKIHDRVAPTVPAPMKPNNLPVTRGGTLPGSSAMSKGGRVTSPQPTAPSLPPFISTHFGSTLESVSSQPHIPTSPSSATLSSSTTTVSHHRSSHHHLSRVATGTGTGSSMDRVGGGTGSSVDCSSGRDVSQQHLQPPPTPTSLTNIDFFFGMNDDNIVPAWRSQSILAAGTMQQDVTSWIVDGSSGGEDTFDDAGPLSPTSATGYGFTAAGASVAATNAYRMGAGSRRPTRYGVLPFRTRTDSWTSAGGTFMSGTASVGYRTGRKVSTTGSAWSVGTVGSELTVPGGQVGNNSSGSGTGIQRAKRPPPLNTLHGGPFMPNLRKPSNPNNVYTSSSAVHGSTSGSYRGTRVTPTPTFSPQPGFKRPHSTCDNHPRGGPRIHNYSGSRIYPSTLSPRSRYHSASQHAVYNRHHHQHHQQHHHQHQHIFIKQHQKPQQYCHHRQQHSLPVPMPHISSVFNPDAKHLEDLPSAGSDANHDELAEAIRLEQSEKQADQNIGSKISATEKPTAIDAKLAKFRPRSLILASPAAAAVSDSLARQQCVSGVFPGCAQCHRACAKLGPTPLLNSQTALEGTVNYGIPGSKTPAETSQSDFSSAAETEEASLAQVDGIFDKQSPDKTEPIPVPSNQPCPGALPRVSSSPDLHADPMTYTPEIANAIPCRPPLLTERKGSVPVYSRNAIVSQQPDNLLACQAQQWTGSATLTANEFYSAVAASAPCEACCSDLQHLDHQHLPNECPTASGIYSSYQRRSQGVSAETLLLEEEEHSEVQEFLHIIGLEKYFPLFEAEELWDMKTVLSLTDADLREIGISEPGPRNEILAAMDKVRYASRLGFNPVRLTSSN